MDEIDHDFQVQHFEAMVAADDRDGASEPLLEKLQFALMRRQFDVGVLHASLRSKCGGDRTLKCSHVPIVRARFGLIVGCSRGSTFTDY